MLKSLLTFTFSCFMMFAFPQSIRFITYNIRYDNAGDSLNRWNNRKDKVARLIQKYDPGIFGIQEGLHNQVEDLKALLPAYNCLGVGRDDGKTKGEYSAIFYKSDEFKVLADSTFWLSENPSVAGSKSWDAAITRICTWAKFQYKQSGHTFYLFNTHFDHQGDTARKKSTLLLREQAIRLGANEPVIIMGDFNSEPSSDPYHLMTDSSFWKLQDSYFAANNLSKTPCTYTGFKVKGNICKRIDYIYYSSGFSVKSYDILHDHDGDYFPSDHLPVMVEMILLKEKKKKL